MCAHGGRLAWATREEGTDGVVGGRSERDGRARGLLLDLLCE